MIRKLLAALLVMQSCNPGLATAASRNVLVLPAAAITKVEVYVPQERIIVADAVNPMPVGGLVEGLIGAAHDHAWQKNVQPHLDVFLQQNDVDHLREEIVPIVQAGLDRDQLPGLKDVVLQPGTLKDSKGNQLASQDQIAALTFTFLLTPRLDIFRVAMVVRIGERAALLRERPGQTPKIPFAQELSYDVPVPAEYRSSVTHAAVYWRGLGEDALRPHVRAAATELMSMLARELGRTPTRGYQRGKQIPWGIQGVANFGVVLDDRGERVWIRLRDGQLASVPKTAIR